MAKVYLETSFFSAMVSTKSSVKSRGWRASSLEWWAERRTHHELYSSSEVIRELANPVFPHRQHAMDYLSEVRIIPVVELAENLAITFVREFVMPAPANAGDALHVAVAATNKADFILSWNIKHLANPNKHKHLSIVCRRAGFDAPRIVTPDML